MINKSSVLAVSTLAGTIIGVGLFSLPYITLRVGLWVILGYFLVIGFLVTLIHVFFAEISLKTPDYKRLPGFAQIYLGSWGRRLSLLSITIGGFGSILAYLIVGGGFLGSLLNPILGGGEMFYVLIYFMAGGVLV